MKKPSVSGRLRIPVKLVEGGWEFAHGGVVPVKDDAEGELIVERNAISDPAFLKRMLQTERRRVLNEGTPLLIGLTVKGEKPPPPQLQELLIKFDVNTSMTSEGDLVVGVRDATFTKINAFVKVTLDRPTEKQIVRNARERGGLWLETEGLQAKGLISSTIQLDRKISPDPVISLNHALTKLSEKFEVWRIAHTGNIYSRVFYQEENEKWYPLEVLRNAALNKTEHGIANALWRDFLTRMSPSHQA